MALLSRISKATIKYRSVFLLTLARNEGQGRIDSQYSKKGPVL